MFPYITDLINYFFGTTLVFPVYTFGFILVLASALSFFFVYIELKRRGKNGQIPLDSYKLTLNILVITGLSSLAGLKFFDIFDNWDLFLKDPLGKLLFFEGRSFYGGFIFGFVGLMSYTRHKSIPQSHVFDIAGLALLIGYAIGRMGCQLSGDGCWGTANFSPLPDCLGCLPDWMWGFRYPHNVLNAGIPIPGYEGTHCSILPWPVFPTPLYESFLALISFIILWSIRKTIPTPGWLFSVFLITFSTSRFFIEFIRVNHKYSLLGMTLSQAQCISIICFLLGIASFWYFRLLHRRVPCVG